MRSDRIENLREGYSPPTADEVVQAAQIACLIEVSASKPGNVSRLYDFHDMHMEDFLLSAAAIGPAIHRAGRASVGEAVLRAVQDTKRLVRPNTNLGIILLLVILVSGRLYRFIRPFDEESVEEEKHLDDEEYIDVHAEVKEIQTDDKSS